VLPNAGERQAGQVAETEHADSEANDPETGDRCYGHRRPTKHASPPVIVGDEYRAFHFDRV